MAARSLRPVLLHLRGLAGGPSEEPDRQLLERFASQRDEAAFAALVQRHGPLVWRVCSRALRQEQDAEDAFQATFLVLARKADSTRWRDSIAGWLYEVAARVAREVRSRRPAPPPPRHPPPSPDPSEPLALSELCAALDDELAALPRRLRLPMVLCYREGETRDRACRQLGWSLRTLERRLEQGRKLLRARLTRRGLTLSGALLAGDLA